MMKPYLNRCIALAAMLCVSGCQSTSSSPAADDGGLIVKSRDGSFSGKVYGAAPAASPLSRLQIGMRAEEVQQIMGRAPDDVRSYPTGKVFIPFYFGSDGARMEWIYKGQGSVAFSAGRGELGMVVVITFDPRI